MLKRNLSYGMVSTVLLGICLAAPAGAECNQPSTPCELNGGGSGGRTGVDSPAPVISYDSSYYGFTTGIYGAANIPFKTDDISDMNITPSLPAGLLFNSATGGITGTPTTPTQGVSTHVIRGMNQHGQSATAVVRIAVNPAPVRAEPAPSPSPADQATPAPSPSPADQATPSPTPVTQATPFPSPGAGLTSATSKQLNGNSRWKAFMDALQRKK